MHSHEPLLVYYAFIPVPNRHHLSCDDCLEVNKEDYLAECWVPHISIADGLDTFGHVCCWT